MDSTAHPRDSTLSRDPPPPVQWRCWPLRDKPWASIVVLSGLLAAGMGVRGLCAETHLAVLAAAALGLAMWRFFVPTWFELNEGGVHQWVLGRHRRIPWDRIFCHEVRATGVLLLPRADACPMDAFRGLYLPWGERRGDVLSHVRYHLK
jgi:hypothetical protein